LPIVITDEARHQGSHRPPDGLHSRLTQSR